MNLSRAIKIEKNSPNTQTVHKYSMYGSLHVFTCKDGPGDPPDEDP